MNAPGLRATLAQALAEELGASLGRITHCANQLSDEQVWWRPRPDMNAIANLMLHLAGNVHQLIVSAIGGEPDHRDRPAEFAAREGVTKSELLARLTSAVGRAKEVIAA